MPFGQDEAVAIGPGGIGRIVAHDVEVERGEDFHGRERSARVAGFGFADHLHDFAADALGDRLQLGYVFGLFHALIT